MNHKIILLILFLLMVVIVCNNKKEQIEGHALQRNRRICSVRANQYGTLTAGGGSAPDAPDYWDCSGYQTLLNVPHGPSDAPSQTGGIHCPVNHWTRNYSQIESPNYPSPDPGCMPHIQCDDNLETEGIVANNSNPGTCVCDFEKSYEKIIESEENTSGEWRIKTPDEDLRESTNEYDTLNYVVHVAGSSASSLGCRDNISLERAKELCTNLGYDNCNGFFSYDRRSGTSSRKCFSKNSSLSAGSLRNLGPPGWSGLFILKKPVNETEIDTPCETTQEPGDGDCKPENVYYENELLKHFDDGNVGYLHHVGAEINREDGYKWWRSKTWNQCAQLCKSDDTCKAFTTRTNGQCYNFQNLNYGPATVNGISQYLAGTPRRVQHHTWFGTWKKVDPEKLRSADDLNLAKHSNQCDRSGLWYHGSNNSIYMDGTPATFNMSEGQCRQRCKDTPGCKYFHRFSGGGCTISDGTGTTGQKGVMWGSNDYGNNRPTHSGSKDCIFNYEYDTEYTEEQPPTETECVPLTECSENQYLGIDNGGICVNSFVDGAEYDDDCQGLEAGDCNSAQHCSWYNNSDLSDGIVRETRTLEDNEYGGTTRDRLINLTDRQCSDLTQCGENQYSILPQQNLGGYNIEDTQCFDLDTCDDYSVSFDIEYNMLNQDGLNEEVALVTDEYGNLDYQIPNYTYDSQTRTSVSVVAATTTGENNHTAVFERYQTQEPDFNSSTRRYTSDRQCGFITNCNENEYESIPPSFIEYCSSNRPDEHPDQTTCVVANFEWINVKISDRVCLPLTVCGEEQNDIAINRPNCPNNADTCTINDEFPNGVMKTRDRNCNDCPFPQNVTREFLDGSNQTLKCSEMINNEEFPIPTQIINEDGTPYCPPGYGLQEETIPTCLSSGDPCDEQDRIGHSCIITDEIVNEEEWLKTSAIEWLPYLPLTFEDALIKREELANIACEAIATRPRDMSTREREWRETNGRMFNDEETEFVQEKYFEYLNRFKEIMGDFAEFGIRNGTGYTSIKGLNDLINNFDALGIPSKRKRRGRSADTDVNPSPFGTKKIKLITSSDSRNNDFNKYELHKKGIYNILDFVKFALTVAQDRIGEDIEPGSMIEDIVHDFRNKVDRIIRMLSDPDGWAERAKLYLNDIALSFSQFLIDTVDPFTQQYIFISTLFDRAYEDAEFMYTYTNYCLYNQYTLRKKNWIRSYIDDHLYLFTDDDEYDIELDSFDLDDCNLWMFQQSIINNFKIHNNEFSINYGELETGKEYSVVIDDINMDDINMDLYPDGINKSIFGTKPNTENEEFDDNDKIINPSDFDTFTFIKRESDPENDILSNVKYDDVELMNELIFDPPPYIITQDELDDILEMINGGYEDEDEDEDENEIDLNDNFNNTGFYDINTTSDLTAKASCFKKYGSGENWHQFEEGSIMAGLFENGVCIEGERGADMTDEDWNNYKNEYIEELISSVGYDDTEEETIELSESSYDPSASGICNNTNISDINICEQRCGAELSDGSIADNDNLSSTDCNYKLSACIHTDDEGNKTHKNVEKASCSGTSCSNSSVEAPNYCEHTGGKWGEMEWEAGVYSDEITMQNMDSNFLNTSFNLFEMKNESPWKKQKDFCQRHSSADDGAEIPWKIPTEFDNRYENMSVRLYNTINQGECAGKPEGECESDESGKCLFSQNTCQKNGGYWNENTYVCDLTINIASEDECMEEYEGGLWDNLCKLVTPESGPFTDPVCVSNYDNETKNNLMDFLNLQEQRSLHQMYSKKSCDGTLDAMNVYGDKLKPKSCNYNDNSLSYKGICQNRSQRGEDCGEPFCLNILTGEMLGLEENECNGENDVWGNHCFQDQYQCIPNDNFECANINGDCGELQFCSEIGLNDQSACEEEGKCLDENNKDIYIIEYREYGENSSIAEIMGLQGDDYVFKKDLITSNDIDKLKGLIYAENIIIDVFKKLTKNQCCQYGDECLFTNKCHAPDENNDIRDDFPTYNFPGCENKSQGECDHPCSWMNSENISYTWISNNKWDNHCISENIGGEQTCSNKNMRCSDNFDGNGLSCDSLYGKCSVGDDLSYYTTEQECRGGCISILNEYDSSARNQCPGSEDYVCFDTFNQIKKSDFSTEEVCISQNNDSINHQYQWLPSKTWINGSSRCLPLESQTNDDFDYNSCYNMNGTNCDQDHCELEEANWNADDSFTCNYNQGIAGDGNKAGKWKLADGVCSKSRREWYDKFKCIPNMGDTPDPEFDYGTCKNRVNSEECNPEDGTEHCLWTNIIDEIDSTGEILYNTKKYCEGQDGIWKDMCFHEGGPCGETINEPQYNTIDCFTCLSLKGDEEKLEELGNVFNGPFDYVCGDKNDGIIFGLVNYNDTDLKKKLNDETGSDIPGNMIPENDGVYGDINYIYSDEYELNDERMQIILEYISNKGSELDVAFSYLDTLGVLRDELQELTNKFLQISTIRNQMTRTLTEVNNTAFVISDVYLFKRTLLSNVIKWGVYDHYDISNSDLRKSRMDYKKALKNYNNKSISNEQQNILNKKQYEIKKMELQRKMIAKRSTNFDSKLVESLNNASYDTECKNYQRNVSKAEAKSKSRLMKLQKQRLNKNLMFMQAEGRPDDINGRRGWQRYRPEIDNKYAKKSQKILNKKEARILKENKRWMKKEKAFNKMGNGSSWNKLIRANKHGGMRGLYHKAKAPFRAIYNAGTFAKNVLIALPTFIYTKIFKTPHFVDTRKMSKRTITRTINDIKSKSGYQKFKSSRNAKLTTWSRQSGTTTRYIRQDIISKAFRGGQRVGRSSSKVLKFVVKGIAKTLKFLKWAPTVLTKGAFRFLMAAAAPIEGFVLAYEIVDGAMGGLTPWQAYLTGRGHVTDDDIMNIQYCSKPAEGIEANLCDAMGDICPFPCPCIFCDMRDRLKLAFRNSLILLMNPFETGIFKINIDGEIQASMSPDTNLESYKRIANKIDEVLENNTDYSTSDMSLHNYYNILKDSLEETYINGDHDINIIDEITRICAMIATSWLAGGESFVSEIDHPNVYSVLEPGKHIARTVTNTTNEKIEESRSRYSDENQILKLGGLVNPYGRKTQWWFTQETENRVGVSQYYYLEQLREQAFLDYCNLGIFSRGKYELDFTDIMQYNEQYNNPITQDSIDTFLEYSTGCSKDHPERCNFTSLDELNEELSKIPVDPSDIINEKYEGAKEYHEPDWSSGVFRYGEDNKIKIDEELGDNPNYEKINGVYYRKNLSLWERGKLNLKYRGLIMNTFTKRLYILKILAFAQMKKGLEIVMSETGSRCLNRITNKYIHLPEYNLECKNPYWDDSNALPENKRCLDQSESSDCSKDLIKEWEPCHQGYFVNIPSDEIVVREAESEMCIKLKDNLDDVEGACGDDFESCNQYLEFPYINKDMEWAEDNVYDHNNGPSAETANANRTTCEDGGGHKYISWKPAQTRPDIQSPNKKRYWTRDASDDISTDPQYGPIVKPSYENNTLRLITRDEKDRSGESEIECLTYVSKPENSYPPVDFILNNGLESPDFSVISAAERTGISAMIRNSNFRDDSCNLDYYDIAGTADELSSVNQSVYDISPFSNCPPPSNYSDPDPISYYVTRGKLAGDLYDFAFDAIKWLGKSSKCGDLGTTEVDTGLFGDRTLTSDDPLRYINTDCQSRLNDNQQRINNIWPEFSTVDGEQFTLGCDNPGRSGSAGRIHVKSSICPAALLQNGCLVDNTESGPDTPYDQNKYSSRFPDLDTLEGRRRLDISSSDLLNDRTINKCMLDSEYHNKDSFKSSDYMNMDVFDEKCLIAEDVSTEYGSKCNYRDHIPTRMGKGRDAITYLSFNGKPGMTLDDVDDINPLGEGYNSISHLDVIHSNPQRGQYYKTNDPNECGEICANNQSCTHFNWYEKTSLNTDSGECYLSDGKGGITNQPYGVGGWTRMGTYDVDRGGAYPTISGTYDCWPGGPSTSSDDSVVLMTRVDLDPFYYTQGEMGNGGLYPYNECEDDEKVLNRCPRKSYRIDELTTADREFHEESQLGRENKGCNYDGWLYFSSGGQIPFSDDILPVTLNEKDCQQYCKDTEGCEYWNRFSNGTCLLSDGIGPVLEPGIYENGTVRVGHPSGSSGHKNCIRKPSLLDQTENISISLKGRATNKECTVEGEDGDTLEEKCNGKPKWCEGNNGMKLFKEDGVTPEDSKEVCLADNRKWDTSYIISGECKGIDVDGNLIQRSTCVPSDSGADADTNTVCNSLSDGNCDSASSCHLVVGDSLNNTKELCEGSNNKWVPGCVHTVSQLYKEEKNSLRLDGLDSCCRETGDYLDLSGTSGRAYEYQTSQNPDDFFDGQEDNTEGQHAPLYHFKSGYQLARDIKADHGVCSDNYANQLDILVKEQDQKLNELLTRFPNSKPKVGQKISGIVAGDHNDSGENRDEKMGGLLSESSDGQTCLNLNNPGTWENEKLRFDFINGDFNYPHNERLIDSSLNFICRPTADSKKTHDQCSLVNTGFTDNQELTSYELSEMCNNKYVKQVNCEESDTPIELIRGREGDTVREKAVELYPGSDEIYGTENITCNSDNDCGQICRFKDINDNVVNFMDGEIAKCSLVEGNIKCEKLTYGEKRQVADGRMSSLNETPLTEGETKYLSCDFTGWSAAAAAGSPEEFSYKDHVCDNNKCKATSVSIPFDKCLDESNLETFGALLDQQGNECEFKWRDNDFNSSNFLGRCALECEKNEKCHGFFLYHNKDLDNVLDTNQGEPLANRVYKTGRCCLKTIEENGNGEVVVTSLENKKLSKDICDKSGTDGGTCGIMYNGNRYLCDWIGRPADESGAVQGECSLSKDPNKWQFPSAFRVTGTRITELESEISGDYYHFDRTKLKTTQSEQSSQEISEQTSSEQTNNLDEMSEEKYSLKDTYNNLKLSEKATMCQSARDYINVNGVNCQNTCCGNECDAIDPSPTGYENNNVCYSTDRNDDTDLPKKGDCSDFHDKGSDASFLSEDMADASSTRNHRYGFTEAEELGHGAPSGEEYSHYGRRNVLRYCDYYSGYRNTNEFEGGCVTAEIDMLAGSDAVEWSNEFIVETGQSIR